MHHTRMGAMLQELGISASDLAAALRPARLPSWKSWLAVARAVRKFDRLQALERESQQREVRGREIAGRPSVPARRRARKLESA